MHKQNNSAPDSLVDRLLDRLDAGRRWRDCKSAGRRLIRRLGPSPDFFLGRVAGVIHIGAHLAEERDLYDGKGLNVVWVEPNPDLFARIEEYIQGHPQQRAFCRLLADADDKEFPFHITSNDGISSSIFELAGHRKLWPNVTEARTVMLRSVTFSSLIAREKLDLRLYDGLVLDVQGAELLVLKGAAPALKHLKFIKAEAADFELYKGCCLLSDLDAFLDTHGFRRVVTSRFRREKGVGSCYDVVYASVSEK
jgi:FkbM family methyltransferase